MATFQGIAVAKNGSVNRRPGYGATQSYGNGPRYPQQRRPGYTSQNSNAANYITNLFGQKNQQPTGQPGFAPQTLGAFHPQQQPTPMPAPIAPTHRQYAPQQIPRPLRKWKRF